MPKLIQSDKWRDGGSMSAIVLDEGRHRSFWLQANRWNHPRDAGHEHLFVSDGDDPEKMEQRIEISSIEERQWLDYLTRVDNSDTKPESRLKFFIS